jgi:NAD(P)-dependent dehydrogenase (short-subunit alcohol dehydrogenase family)
MNADSKNAGAGRLAGKTCLIVGGTGGIGQASARRFREEGARVIVAGRPGDDGADLEVELIQPTSVNALFEAVNALGGRLDILFHVAGASGRSRGDGPLDECSDEGWDWVIDVNARGTFLTNRAAVRRMLVQPRDEAGLRGTILNMGTVLTQAPSPRYFGTIAYAASKGAVHTLTLAAAARYAADGIRFNLLAPGLIDTPMARRAVGEPEIRTYLETKQPLAGGPGTPEDCAEAALYLCEPASHFVTGVVLEVDGGWRLAEGRIPS